MERRFAIKMIVDRELLGLSKEERADQLEVMTMENWSETEGWSSLSLDIQKEFSEGDLREDPASSRYDAVTSIWLADRLIAVTNEYLLSRLGELGLDVGPIEGGPVVLEACPCCGRRTLGARGDYEICSVCWWEDDGQDNENASVVMGGPNYHLSLTQGRYNFILAGISDPSRSDLSEVKHAQDRYEQGREFRLVEKNIIVEVGSKWRGSASETKQTGRDD